MEYAALLLFEGLRLVLRLMLLVLSGHFLRAAWTARRAAASAPPAMPDPLPSVTVQLPMRNEYYVSERVITAACHLDYPRDKLSVQVLDDSSDATRERVAEVVARLAAQGHRVTLLHRAAPTGYKAGALNAGLEHAEGDIVAMFDADCVPPADFLQRTLPWFSRPEVGCVQARWSFLNRERSVLTRVQAIVLDGLFGVDQPARAASDLPLQFNGTNGLWRRRALEEAGGWDAGNLAEDCDLSFRAQMRGWKVVPLWDYAVPTEIPEDMPAFRAQQRRWALGSAQIVRALGPTILRSDLPARAKLMMFMHLGRHSIDPLILLACVTAPLTNLYGMPFLLDYGPALNTGLVLLAAMSACTFYVVASRKVAAPTVNLIYVPLVVPLAIGLSLLYTVAFAHGLLSVGGRFVRTPKSGGAATPSGPRYRSPFAALAFVELFIAGAHAYFAYSTLARSDLAYGLFFAVVSLSFGWVSLASLFSRRS